MENKFTPTYPRYYKISGIHFVAMESKSRGISVCPSLHEPSIDAVSIDSYAKSGISVLEITKEEFNNKTKVALNIINERYRRLTS